MVNVYNSEWAYDLTCAIIKAVLNSDGTRNLTAGDVMLIEQQTSVRSDCWAENCWVPVECIEANYNAIQYATAAGVVVVKEAGNGGEDLDGAEACPFLAGRPDSGAIIVGAGGSGLTSLPRQRLTVSTFGSRVNLQGWGDSVTTTGCCSTNGCAFDVACDLQDTGDMNQDYSQSFGGSVRRRTHRCCVGCCPLQRRTGSLRGPIEFPGHSATPCCDGNAAELDL